MCFKTKGSILNVNCIYVHNTVGSNFHTMGTSSEGSRVQLHQGFPAAVYSVRNFLPGNVQFLIMRESLFGIGIANSSVC